MRVLGIDPGLTRCGLGVVDSRPGRRVALVDVGVVRTPAGAELTERLLTIAVALDTWLDRHSPDVVAVERVFSQRNVRTVMGTAQASGVAVLAAARRRVPVTLHTPSEVKAAVTGSGRADKEQVTTMVTRILGLARRPRPADSADALALAICHLWRDGRGTGTPGRQPSTGATPAQRRWIEAAEAAGGAGSRPRPPAGRDVRPAGGSG